MNIRMKYGNEGMDCKKYVLLFLGKIRFVILAAVMGAAFGAGIYFFWHVVINSNREYQAESYLKLDFATDPTGAVYEAYNGYTWNDLMSTDAILNATMSYLPDDYTKEEVLAATSAQILSDIHFLTITITTSDADRTAAILKATDLSLVEMGTREKEFLSIEIEKETEPQMLAADPRLLQAAIVGFAVALAAAIFAIALLYVLNDKIYVPGDLKSVTSLSFIGFCFTKEEHVKSDREKKLLEQFQNDLEQNRAYITEKNGTTAVLELTKGVEITRQMTEDIRRADGVLLVIPYGQMDRTTCGYRIEQLELLECKPVGFLIQDADMRFMKWYYNHL
ncbi:MAG: hypothetical protein NC231_01540 [Bacillus sp. (in: Bacteria)]|nr:hypothetical protein [Bacillus sp. (in: firmicutes)]MCM1427247.1 hypothetical protein [Eubacterium sp.]